MILCICIYHKKCAEHTLQFGICDVLKKGRAEKFLTNLRKLAQHLRSPHTGGILKRVVVVVVVGYPTPSEGWDHGGRPWSPRSRATPQGLDQRSYRNRESPKSERRKESVAGQFRMR